MAALSEKEIAWLAVCSLLEREAACEGGYDPVIDARVHEICQRWGW